MPETEGGVPVGDFSKPPAGGKLLTQDDLTNMADDNKQIVGNVAEALGGRVVGEGEVGKNIKPKSHDDDPELADVSLEDRRQFIRTLLAGQQFQKQYEIFGGAVKLVFQTRRQEDNLRIKKEAKGDAVERERLRLKSSMVSAVFPQGANAISNNVDAVSDILYSAVLKEFRKFEKLCDLLFKKADDPNFWTETGGHS